MEKAFKGAPVEWMEPCKYLKFTADGYFVNGNRTSSYYGVTLLHSYAGLKGLFAAWANRYPNIKAVCMTASYTPVPQKCSNAKNYKIGGPKGRKPGPNLWYWIEYKDGTVSRPCFVDTYKDGFGCIFNGFGYLTSKYVSLSDMMNQRRGQRHKIQDWLNQKVFS